MEYMWAFIVGGLLCAIGQLLIDYTRLTPARILVAYVVAGVILSGIGWYKPLVELAGAGASVPLTGFGNLLAEGVRKAVDENGLIGAFTGGFTASAGGITAAPPPTKHNIYCLSRAPRGGGGGRPPPPPPPPPPPDKKGDFNSVKVATFSFPTA